MSKHSLDSESYPIADRFHGTHGKKRKRDFAYPKVKAISFVGSTPVAKYIYEVGTKHGKRVQSNGGAKNFVLLMPSGSKMCCFSN